MHVAGVVDGDHVLVQLLDWLVHVLSLDLVLLRPHYYVLKNICQNYHHQKPSLHEVTH